MQACNTEWVVYLWEGLHVWCNSTNLQGDGELVAWSQHLCGFPSSNTGEVLAVDWQNSITKPITYNVWALWILHWYYHNISVSVSLSLSLSLPLSDNTEFWLTVIFHRQVSSRISLWQQLRGHRGKILIPSPLRGWTPRAGLACCVQVSPWDYHTPISVNERKNWH